MIGKNSNTDFVRPFKNVTFEKIHLHIYRRISCRCDFNEKFPIFSNPQYPWWQQYLRFLVSVKHRDKTRVQMPAKMFPHLKLLCWLFMGPTLGFDTKQSNSFLNQIWCFFNNKNKILTILFIAKYVKITLKWWVFSVVGAHKQQVFCMLKWGKKTKGACSSPISMV
jgi:hypothetical protein